MRALRWLPLLLLLAAAPTLAAEPACPLDVATCLSRYQRTKERPWLGVHFEDSTGRIVVTGTEPGSPARRAGLRAGDVISTIEGQPPVEWFAGKAGWKDGDQGPVDVLRDGKKRTLKVHYEAIPEDVFARMIGTHMLEGHLAHMPKAGTEQH